MMPKILKLILKGSDLNEEKVSCTGPQISMVLAEIKNFTSACLWYGVDIFAPALYTLELYSGLEEIRQVPQKLGTTDELIQWASPVPQFERGLFLGVERSKISSLGAIAWAPDEFDTEDTEYIEPSLIMIRAFDTSYFEILSKNQEMMNHLAARFPLAQLLDHDSS